jgi:hypothetical protein
MNTVVTMTSYPKRISAVAEFIYIFMNTQTVKPDYFYIWLSEEEFPLKEASLPTELVKICKYFKIIIRWVPYNDGCTKRWGVYPEHYNDIVVAIDEDNVYDFHLVERMRQYEKPANTIYAVFDSLTNYLVPVGGIEFKYRHYKKLNLPNHSLRMKISGQSVVPPRTFPLDALNPDYLNLRLKYCPKCDESWLQPFYKFNSIEFSCMKLDKLRCDDSMNSTGLAASGKVIDGVWWKNVQMYLVLRLFPDLMRCHKRIFPEYDTAKWDIKPIDDINQLLRQ